MRTQSKASGARPKVYGNGGQPGLTVACRFVADAHRSQQHARFVRQHRQFFLALAGDNGVGAALLARLTSRDRSLRFTTVRSQRATSQP